MQAGCYCKRRVVQAHQVRQEFAQAQHRLIIPASPDCAAIRQHGQQGRAPVVRLAVLCRYAEYAERIVPRKRRCPFGRFPVMDGVACGGRLPVGSEDLRRIHTDVDDIGSHVRDRHIAPPRPGGRRERHRLRAADAKRRPIASGRIVEGNRIATDLRDQSAESTSEFGDGLFEVIPHAIVEALIV